MGVPAKLPRPAMSGSATMSEHRLWPGNGWFGIDHPTVLPHSCIVQTRSRLERRGRVAPLRMVPADARFDPYC
jgi:hypothetical protein